jgi:hypothetical protein
VACKTEAGTAHGARRITTAGEDHAIVDAVLRLAAGLGVAAVPKASSLASRRGS